MSANVPPRQFEVSEVFNRWMKRRTPPSHFAGDEQAEADELASLLSALMRHAPFVDVGAWVSRVTAYLEERSKYRVWPSLGEVVEACELINARKAGGGKAIQRGDRSKLTRDQLYLLESQILPTARRWVQEIPGLAHHGRQTLEFWGEEA